MSIDIRENVLLSDYTTLKIGGVARYFVRVNTIEEVDKAVKFAKQISQPYLVLGGGSNLLIADKGFAGLVIHNNLRGVQFVETKENETVELIAGAGEVFDEIIIKAVNNNYFGLENLSSIPGTVGATPVQNVGAYGVEVGDIISKVETYHVPTESIKIFTSKECEFGYRDSFFKTKAGKEFIITAVHFSLTKNYQPKIHYKDLSKIFEQTEPTLKEIREAVIAIRAQKFPDWHIVGTAGSFFKNPIITSKQAKALQAQYPELPLYDLGNGEVKIPLGYVLDNICGLKGYFRGRVGLFEKQALVLINHGDATADEVLEFIKFVEQKVFDKTEIKIKPEVRFVGM